MFRKRTILLLSTLGMGVLISATLLMITRNSNPLPTPIINAFPSTEEAPSTIVPHPPPPNDPFEIRLAWYYNKPRNDADMVQIVEWYDFFILIQGDDKERNQMISLGAKRPILEYFEFESIHDPGSCDKEPKVNQVAYLPGDFCTIAREHADWFLLDQFGNRIIVYEDDASWVLMDPANPGWQEFFLDRIRRSQAGSNWDGVFLDNLPATLAFREFDGQIPALYPDDASYDAAIQNFLAYLQNNYFIPNNKLLFANLVSRRDDARWTEYISHLNGVMHEGWAIDQPSRYRPVEVWEKHLQLAEETQAMGKTILLISQGEKDDLELQEFAFASYLLVNHGRAVFRYANSNDYREVWLYANYTLELGRPLGPRYQDGKIWQRDFTNGSVIVNPSKHFSEITVKKE